MTSKGFGLLPRPQHPKSPEGLAIRAMDAVRRPSEQDRIEQLRKDAGAPTKQTDSVTVAQEARGNADSTELPNLEPPATTSEASPTATLDAAALQRLIDQAARAQALETQLATVTQQQEKDAAEHQEQLSQLQQQVTAANTAVADAIAAQEKSDQQIQQLFQISGGDARGTGAPNAMFNTIVSTRSDKAPGAAGDWLGLWEKAPAFQMQDAQGHLHIARDNTELNAFIREQKRLDGYSELLKGLDKWAKANGLLRGSGNRPISGDAATTKANIPDGFLPALAAIIRMTHSPSFIFWQFPNIRLDFGKGTGDTIKIPRFAYQATPTASTDRLLSSGGTFARINANDQNLLQGAVSAVLNEYGLGLNATYPPLAIPQFVTATSMLELMPVLQRNLGYDYNFWEDLAIYELWDATSRVVYSDAGNVTTTATDVGTNDGGVVNRAFLRNLYAYMRSQQIPTYQNGCYGIALNTYAAATLKASLEEFAAPPTPQDIQDVTNMLNLATAGEMDRVSGYVGQYENFMCFESNAFGCGAAGTRGSQTVTLGAGPGAQTLRSSFAFGADSIGRGIGQEMEIRRDNNDDFQRLDRYIWRSLESFVALDVDPTGYSDSSLVPQQLRVVEVRSLAVPV